MAHDHNLAELLARREAVERELAAAELAQARLKRDLVALDAEIAAAREESDRDSLPCWHCQHPSAADVRHYLGNNSGSYQRSPSGWPILCCRVSAPVAAFALR